MKCLKELMDWYQSNCDGDWEHTFGIKIETSDNPGWIIEVDIMETDIEGKTINQKSINDDEDWYFIRCDGEIFKASGDPTKLQFLIDHFIKLVKQDL